MLTVRRYEETDIKAVVALFYDTVHRVNASDYDERQLDAWATGKENIVEWNVSLTRNYTLIAEVGGRIVGFGDIEETGYLNRLYVSAD